MKIKFFSEQIYESGGPGVGPVFPKGSTLSAADVGQKLGTEVSPDYAHAFLNRWVQRGVAVRVSDDAPDEAGEASEGADTVDLYALTRAELDALAKARGVDISSARNKGDVVAAIEAADKAATEANEGE